MQGSEVGIARGFVDATVLTVGEKDEPKVPCRNAEHIGPREARVGEASGRSVLRDLPAQGLAVDPGAQELGNEGGLHVTAATVLAALEEQSQQDLQVVRRRKQTRMTGHAAERMMGVSVVDLTDEGIPPPALP